MKYKQNEIKTWAEIKIKRMIFSLYSSHCFDATWKNINHLFWPRKKWRQHIIFIHFKWLQHFKRFCLCKWRSLKTEEKKNGLKIAFGFISLHKLLNQAIFHCHCHFHYFSNSFLEHLEPLNRLACPNCILAAISNLFVLLSHRILVATNRLDKSKWSKRK